MDATVRARRVALRRETMIAAAMNVVLGILFFLLIFGWKRSTTIAIAVDFLPQTMAMTFLGGMVSSLICLSRVARGTLVPAGPVPTRWRQAMRVFGWAIGATIVFGGGAALCVARFGPADFAPATALALKSLYGLVMGFLTTPPIVRLAIGMPSWPFTAGGSAVVPSPAAGLVSGHDRVVDGGALLKDGG